MVEIVEAGREANKVAKEMDEGLGYGGTGHVHIFNSLDQNKLFVSEPLTPLTQFANGYKEPTKQFSDL